MSGSAENSESQSAEQSPSKESRPSEVRKSEGSKLVPGASFKRSPAPSESASSSSLFEENTWSFCRAEEVRYFEFEN